MILSETLTKENFWNEMYSTYPNACKIFCDWIDEYKETVKWWELFNAGNPSGEGQKQPPKFHEIPYAMQQGIWIEFANQTVNEYFEQPEYSYCGDLAEDIKTVFTELEIVLGDR